MLLVLLLAAERAFPAFERLTVGARPVGMAGAYVGLAQGPEALLINPAGIATASGITGAAFYGRPFGLKELDASGVSLFYPLRYGGLGGAVRLFGRSPYQEQVFSLGAGMVVLPHLYVGAAAHLYHLCIASYGSASTAGADLGLLMSVAYNVRWGVVVSNLNRPRIGDCREQLPQVFATGVSITPAPPLVVTVDLHKDVRYPAEVRIGTSYRPLAPLALRCGLQTNPGRFAAGIGLWAGIVRMDYAVSYHYDLGLSHSVSVTVGIE
ncbi:MAG: hypothetical protein QHJ34_15900 [bacterium]|jgi:hypothetical protein|nr:hypothetical protein [candidate division KSB1 bacterium]MDH7561686.1 hypothetical protein [bacterium]